MQGIAAALPDPTEYTQLLRKYDLNEYVRIKECIGFRLMLDPILKYRLQRMFGEADVDEFMQDCTAAAQRFCMCILCL